MSDAVTNCRDCRFAEYRGDMQVGCMFGRIEKFEGQGGEVVGLDDGEKKFLTIRGRDCTAGRWSGKHPEAAVMSDAEAVRLARESFTSQCTFLVYVPGGAGVDDLLATVRSVQRQTLPPRAIRVIHGSSNPDWPAYSVAVRGLNLNFSYRFHRLEPPTEEQDAAYKGDARLRAFDVGADDCDTVFYAAAVAGYEWHPDFLRRVDHALNDEMIRLVALRPDAYGDGLFVQVGLHTGLGGNRERPILEKLGEITEAEGTGHLVKSWEDLPDVAST